MAYRCCTCVAFICRLLARAFAQREHPTKINIKFRESFGVNHKHECCLCVWKIKGSRHYHLRSMSERCECVEGGALRVLSSAPSSNASHMWCMNMIIIIIISYYNMLKFINNNDVIKCICLHTSASLTYQHKCLWFESSDSSTHACVLPFVRTQRCKAVEIFSLFRSALCVCALHLIWLSLVMNFLLKSSPKFYHK